MSPPLTPPEVARQLRVDVHAVLAWIKSGELRAVNCAVNRNGKRPRWRIDADDLAQFERGRMSGPPVKPVRRRQESCGLIQYF